ncbi:MFS transporter [Rothia uropygialis]|uniref:MFS transporter n=1 Tax=Kocuria sp. 36 TaxID=1415402 RepID=UPI00101CEC80|nr:MFS transporter [Kocuria sp. 36]
MTSPYHLIPARPSSVRGSWLPLAGLAAVFLIEMLDNSILNVALPTIGRRLHASGAALEWITLTYTVIFGGLMIALGALADRFGRRRMMLVGLIILAVASLSTLLVTAVWQLIVIRAITGIAAAMTAPGSMALAFRLFDADELRVRSMNIISTVGLIGMAIGPIAGGFILALAPWQALLAINAPIAVLAMIGIRSGIPADRPDELHRAPIDFAGSLLGTVTIMVVLLVPTLFTEAGSTSVWPWAAIACAVVAAVLFVVREHRTPHPVIDLGLLARPLVASGVLFKAAASLATGALGYLVTLHLQLAFDWTPGRAALGMLPQVIVLIAGGALVGPLIARAGMTRAAWYSSSVIVAGLAVYGLLGTRGYAWIAAALVLVATGMRIVGVVAGTNVMRGLPEDRTTVGAALADTAGQVGASIGLALAGTILTALFTGTLAAGNWTEHQYTEFDTAITVAGIALALVTALIVAAGIVLSRNRAQDESSQARQ